MLIGREKFCCALIGYDLLEPPLLLQPSTMSALKEKCASLGPREAVPQTKANGGGVTKVESSAQMP